MFHVPEKYRLKPSENRMMGSDESYGNNGAFKIPLSNRTTIFCIVSDELGWEHVSSHAISDGKYQTPTWAQMCKIKDVFWDDTDCVIQYHPPKSEYVNNHPYTLHLWRPVNEKIPQPDNILV